LSYSGTLQTFFKSLKYTKRCNVIEPRQSVRQNNVVSFTITFSCYYQIDIDSTLFFFLTAIFKRILSSIIRLSFPYQWWHTHKMIASCVSVVLVAVWWHGTVRQIRIYGDALTGILHLRTQYLDRDRSIYCVIRSKKLRESIS